MNKQMIWGLIRHAITVISGAVIAGGAGSIDEAIPQLINGIMTGDLASIAPAVAIVFCALWSMWVKATEGTKEAVVKTLTLRA